MKVGKQLDVFQVKSVEVKVHEDEGDGDGDEELMRGNMHEAAHVGRRAAAIGESQQGGSGSVVGVDAARLGQAKVWMDGGREGWMWWGAGQWTCSARCVGCRSHMKQQARPGAGVAGA